MHGNCGKGKGIEWIRETLAYEGDECRLFPMSKDRYGYGVFEYMGKSHYAHQYVCSAVHGPKPPRHDCSHSCGNGHLGCATKKHLSWKTREENLADMRLHGRAKKSGSPRRKLTDEQVVQIRAMEGTHDEIAKVFGVHRITIGTIKSGRERPDRPHRPRTPIGEPRRSQMAVRAKELRAQDRSYRDIGIEIGCSRGTAKVLARC